MGCGCKNKQNQSVTVVKRTAPVRATSPSRNGVRNGRRIIRRELI